MASATTFPTPCPLAARPRLQLRAPARMRRCECAGVAFADVIRAVQAGQTVEQVCQRTGCGQTCGACLPDLQHALLEASRG